MTPFYAAYGQHPENNFADVRNSSTNVPAAEEWVDTMVKMREDMRENIQAAQERMSKYYNKKVSETKPEFGVGDKVMVNAKNIKTRRTTKKFDHKLRGPFKVRRLIGTHAYELELPPSVGKIHPVFHVSLLEPYHSNNIPDRRSPTPVDDIDMEETSFDVERVLGSKLDHGTVKYFVHWEGQPSVEDTWEPYDNLVGGGEDAVKDFHIRHPNYPMDPRVRM
jgi:hypothetical protein